MLDLTLPKYTPASYKKMTEFMAPIVEYGGYSIKRGDEFYLGAIQGMKVLQCLHVVNSNLDHIKENCNGGILTAAGLPSPQPMIVAAVAKYFGLKCAVTIPKYVNDKRDFNRINASMAQKLGADVYGVGNPNPAGPECDAKHLEKELGYFRIKFGMCGDVAMEPVIEQVQNVPDYVKNIVIIGGSGLSALSVLLGITKWKKKVNTLHVVCLSGFTEKNKKKWYDTNPLSEKCQTKLHIVKSSFPYRQEYKWNNSFDFDLTYESKAYKWMVDNFKPSKEVLFWVVGKKLYDLDLIEPIIWHMSQHEKELREPANSLIEKFMI